MGSDRFGSVGRQANRSLENLAGVSGGHALTHRAAHTLVTAAHHRTAVIIMHRVESFLLARCQLGVEALNSGHVIHHGRTMLVHLG